MRHYSQAIFQTGKQNIDLLCISTAIFALIFALPLLDFICHLPFAIWEQQNYPTGMTNAMIEMWIPFSNVLSAAAFVLLSIMLLKSPGHIAELFAIAAIAAAELINGIANLSYSFMRFSYQNSMIVTNPDDLLLLWNLIQAIITILYAFLWLLPILAHFQKKENGLFVLIPTIFFLLRVLFGIITGSMSETYYISQFIQTAMIVSLSILLLNKHRKPAIEIMKSLKTKEL